MDASATYSDASKWQQYKEWLIEQTAASPYPADANTLQLWYEESLLAPPNSIQCEARAWLQNPIAPGLLAVNRFAGTDAALEFVEDLYMFGARGVYVTNIEHRKSYFDRGGPASDELTVILPNELSKRRAILDIAEVEADMYDHRGDRIEDSGGDEISFWWD